MTLYDLNENEKAIITKVKGRGAFRKRIIEMGFVAGKEITVVKKAPLKDPVEYNIMGYNVSLRNSEARLIEITLDTEWNTPQDENGQKGFEGELLLRNSEKAGKTIQVAFVGNPNSGKTTLFNYASGSKEKVGNYGGVTVDAKEARFKQDGYLFQVVDLPGTYSLTAYSPEELFVRDHISETMPDVIINVVDASNLERNLYLTTQLIDMDIRVVVALNMFDEIEKNHDHLNYTYLGQLLGVPFVPTVGSKGRGIKELFSKVIDVYEGKEMDVRHIHINYGSQIEESISAIQKKIKIPQNKELTDVISSRFLAIKLLEKDREAESRISQLCNTQSILSTVDVEISRLQNLLGEDSETLVTNARYGFISGALRETYQPAHNPERYKPTDVIDNIVTHKFWGIPIFLMFMWLTFYATFRIGQYPVGWIEAGVAALSDFLSRVMSDGMLKDLIIQGIIGGVGGVIVFLPNILLLYFFTSFMEDTGYMARAVFIMDKAMHKIGLHGKSFIPLLMGFGCNVPAILSTRIIESRRDRLITMLINPFMSCSARLPVFVLFISAFFTSYQGSILFALYGIGALLAIASAWLLRKTVLRKEEIPFVMELPPYRVPTLRAISLIMWHRTQQYLKKIGGVILVASIIIWALSYFPLSSHRQLSKTEAQARVQINESNIQQQLQQQESYIGQIGKFIEPAIQPLGFDWKMGVGLLTGIAGKEIVVGTLGVLYHGNDNRNNPSHLVEALPRQAVFTENTLYARIVAFSFMLFILIYFPCIAVVAAIRKESGHWKWALFTIIYTTALAWLISFAFYRIGLLFI